MEEGPNGMQNSRMTEWQNHSKADRQNGTMAKSKYGRYRQDGRMARSQYGRLTG